MVYIGDKLGLFRLLAEKGPMNAEQLALAADCHPRYVEEWANTSVVNSFLEVESGNYFLAPHQKAVFVQEAGPAFQTGTAQMVMSYALQTGNLIEKGFMQGGGVSYAEYGQDLVDGIRRCKPLRRVLVLFNGRVPCSFPSCCRMNANTHQTLLPGWVTQVTNVGSSDTIKILDIGCVSLHRALALWHPLFSLISDTCLPLHAHTVHTGVRRFLHQPR